MSLLTFDLKGTPIRILLRTRCPAAVRWFVIAIIVLSVQHQFGMRTPTHIGQEVAEIVPSFTNVYSPASPILPFGVIGIHATLNHRSPNPVFCGHLSSDAVPMPEIGILMMASATARRMTPVFPSEVIAENDFTPPTVTYAEPPGAPAPNFGCASYHKQPVKSLPGSVNQGSSHAVSIPLPALRGEV